MADWLQEKYGVSKRDLPVVSANPSSSIANQLQKKAPGFAQAVLGSIGSIASQAPTMLRDAVVSGMQPIKNTFNNVVQGQLTKFDEKARADQLASIDASQAKWDKMRKDGKLSKERYKQLSRQNQEEYRKLGINAEKTSKEFADPEQAVKDAIITGASPLLLAGGKLVGPGEKAASAAGKFLPNLIPEAVKATPLALTRRAIATPALYVPAAQAALDVPGQVARGDYKNAAINAATSYTPQILSTAEKGLKWAGKAAKKAVYNTSGMFDNITLSGGKTVNQLFKETSKTDPTTAKKFETVLRQMQDYNMRDFKGDKVAAAQKIIEDIGEKRLSKMSLAEFTERAKKFINADMELSKIPGKLKPGQTLVTSSGKEFVGNIDRIGATKSSQKEVANLTKLIKESKSSADLGQKLSQYVDENKRFYSVAKNADVLDEIVNSGKYGDEAVQAIKGKLIGTNQLFIKEADGTLKPITKNGYFLAERSSDTKFLPVGQTGKIETGNKAPLGKVGDALHKVGLSTEEQTGQARIYKQIRDTFSNKLGTINRPGKEPLRGSTVFTKLEKYMDSTKDVTDIRQLKVKEIANQLGTTEADSKMILKALKDSFLTIPTAERGLAGKIVDINLAKNPLASPYSRIQGEYRYAKNPFFKLQETIETRLGVKGLTGASPKWGKDYTETRNILKQNGVLAGSYAGEGAGDSVSRISAKLMPNQEKTLAAGFETLAEKQGVSVQKFITDPKNASLVDNLKAVVQYPEKGLTSSNFMKALNLAAFPTRYNIKVTQLAYKALRQRPGIEQIAIVNGLSDFNNFMQSDEGIKWQSKNSELLGLVRYFTPVGSVESVMRTLSGKVRTPKDLGSIGGLPFGVVSQVLQGQGIVKLDSPYMDPKTGEVVPDKIPKDTKARLEQLLTDVVGTFYIYPGRLAGGKDVMSKTELSKGLVGTATLGAVSGGKYESVKRGELTPEQQRVQKVLQAGNAKSAPTPSVSAPARPITIPTRSLSRPVPTIKQKKAKTRAKRIGQPF